jgi:hypothetical protein
MSGETIGQLHAGGPNVLRLETLILGLAGLMLAGCGHSEFAVRPIPRIAADTVGKPVLRLEEAFGQPRKVDRTPTKLVYVWFVEQIPAGAPPGFHGCEMEVTVDTLSMHVLGFSLSNIGWGRCSEIERKIRLAEPGDPI